MLKEQTQSAGATEREVVQTSRFGELHVAADKFIVLEKPVLGFENHKRFVLVDNEEMAPFIWLQAVDEPELAFLMINPTLFFEDYSIEINPKEVEDINVIDGSEVETFVIITAPGDPRKMTANLQGPIVINTRTKQAKQLVLTNSRHSVCEPLFDSENVGTKTKGVLKRRETANV